MIGADRVAMQTTLDDFRQFVGWLEIIAPADAQTRDLRAELDRIDRATEPVDHTALSVCEECGMPVRTEHAADGRILSVRAVCSHVGGP